MDGKECIEEQGRTGDGSDENIVSNEFAQQVVLNKIGKLKKIEPIILQVALKDD